jgi:hypothetical protein
MHTYNAPGGTYSGERGDYQVSPQKVRAKVAAVDLDNRSVTVVSTKKDGTFKVGEVGPEGRSWSQVRELELTFNLMTGQENIKVTGNAAKKLGKKSMTLEELHPGAEIKVEYYPVPRIIREMTVERAGS